MVMDVLGIGAIIAALGYLVLLTWDSTAIPWPLRVLPLLGMVQLVLAGVTGVHLLAAMGGVLVVGGGLIYLVWDRFLGGTRQDSKGRHGIRRGGPGDPASRTD